MTTLQQRRVTRHDTNCNAQVQIGSVVMEGKILDYSKLGAFFTPEISHVDGRLIQGDDALDSLAQHDVCSVRLLGRGGETTVEFMMESKWIGMSLHHGCFGVGFENLTQVDIQDVRKAA